MNQHIQRILQAERAARLVPASGVLRTHNENGAWDTLTRGWCNWFDEVTKPSILPATVPLSYTEHQFDVEALRMPLKAIPVLRASLVNTDMLDCDPDMVEGIIRAHPRYEQWKLINEYSTYPDLLTITLNNWLKDKADYWHIEDGVAYGLIENWEAAPICVGWAYGTPMWKLVCLLMKWALNAGLFSFELEESVDRCEENILDHESHETGDKEECDAARKEDWMQPWFPDALRQLYRNSFRLHDQVKALNLPVPLTKAIQELLQVTKRCIRLHKGRSDYDVCRKIDPDGEYSHEQNFSQVYWGENDSWLSSYIDEYLESQLQMGSTIICATAILRINKFNKEVLIDTTPHYQQRVKLRHAYIQCLDQLKELQSQKQT